MKTAICKVKGISPLSFSKFISIKKEEKEGENAFELRTCRERMHYDSNGNVFIPGAMFKNSISAAAKYLSMQIPGKGKSTYTKNIEAGIMCIENLNLNIHKDDVEMETLFVPSQGQRGGSKRVPKHFPKIKEWEGYVTFVIIDSIITKEVFKRHLEEAGSLIGIGRFRPRNNGYYGRFIVESIEWS